MGQSISGLFEDGPESALRHIAGMVGNSGVSVRLLVVPDFVAAGGLPVKGKAERLKAPGYFAVAETGQPPHSGAYHQGTIERLPDDRQV